jgi:phage terminase large subunit
MRFVLSDIRNSIYQEIADRIEEQGVTDTVTKDLSFICGNNTINGIGFRKSSGDQKSKLKSLANYNCVIIEEADEVSEEDFQQLDDSLRTLKSDISIILLLNPPPKNHWVIKRWFNLLPTEQEGFYLPELRSTEKDVIYIRTTFRDNIVNINESTIKNFERYKENKPDHYHSMIEGLVTEGKRGRIFKDWKPISKEKYEAIDIAPYYGLDYGFTNDPSALTEIKEHNNKVYTRQLIYKTGMTNQDIAKEMVALGVSKMSKIYADSSEPKSIEEIRKEGWNIEGAVKGQGSVSAGIDMLLDKEIYYTEDSDKAILEIENYCWKLDRNKEPTNDPIDDFNHYIDSVRYGVFSNSSNKKSFGFI